MPTLSRYRAVTIGPRKPLWQRAGTSAANIAISPTRVGMKLA
jgi:hypothetical protein